MPGQKMDDSALAVIAVTPCKDSRTSYLSDWVWQHDPYKEPHRLTCVVFLETGSIPEAVQERPGDFRGFQMRSCPGVPAYMDHWM